MNKMSVHRRKMPLRVSHYKLLCVAGSESLLSRIPASTLSIDFWTENKCESRNTVMFRRHWRNPGNGRGELGSAWFQMGGMSEARGQATLWL